MPTAFGQTVVRPYVVLTFAFDLKLLKVAFWHAQQYFVNLHLSP
jgi:hypothetical protein